MDGYTRFAIYTAPPAESGLADFGASWLGWDARTGADTAQPDVPGLPHSLSKVTEQPRKYGFHGTIKPPFRLVEGRTFGELHAAARDLCAGQAPVTLAGLKPAWLGRFIALVPEGDTGALADLAATMVRGLDAFRAPPTETELLRRRAGKLNPRQEENLSNWGYPYVLDEFRYHMTLSGPLDPHTGAVVLGVVAPLVAPHLDRPWVVDHLCLFGERERDGRFEILQRYTLMG